MDKIYFAGSTDTYGKEVFVYNPVVTAVETAEMEANNMVVYPNPSNGVLYLKGLQNQNAAYEIYNLTGQSVEKGFVQNAMVDYNVETGVYLLKITDGATNNVQVITVK